VSEHILAQRVELFGSVADAVLEGFVGGVGEGELGEAIRVIVIAVIPAAEPATNSSCPMNVRAT
jgi:hypothetical protein